MAVREISDTTSTTFQFFSDIFASQSKRTYLSPEEILSEDYQRKKRGEIGDVLSADYSGIEFKVREFEPNFVNTTRSISQNYNFLQYW